MSFQRTLCSRALCPLGRAVARGHGHGPVAGFTSLTDAPPADRRSQRPTAESVDSSMRAQRRDEPGRSQPRDGRPPRRTRSAPTNDSAMAVFNDVVQKSDKDASGSSSSSGASTLSALELAAKVKELRFTRAPAVDRLGAFKRHVWPRLRAMGSPLPQHLYKEVNQLLRRICEDLNRSGLLKGSIGQSVIEIYASIGKNDLAVRTGIILNTCLAVATEKNPAKRNAMARDIVLMWQSISQMKRPTQIGQPLQFSLPDHDHVAQLLRSAHDIETSENPAAKYGEPVTRYDFTTRAMAAMFNQFSTGEAQRAMPGLLVTLAVFADEQLVRPDVLKELAPLLDLSRLVLSKCKIDEAFMDTVLDTWRYEYAADRQPDLRNLLRERWPRAQRLLENPALWRRGSGRKVDPATASATSLAHFHKQLRLAQATDNTGAIVSIWRRLRASQAAHPSQSSEMRDDPEFMDLWHFVWCAQRRPDLLKETQEVMREIGLDPTIKTYTAMMHGWKLSKDAAKMGAMWDMLLQSSVKLDAHAWTERISGLIELGQVQKGINTLGEMMDHWKAAVNRGDGEDAVRPTIEMVNAAFKPLIRSDKKTAYAVLKWAEQEGIQPDVLTYNMLLKECFRNGNAEQDVQSLLKTMKGQGVEPDAATFTILLDEVLGSLGDASSGEQVAAIDHIMADIKAAGVQPNLETYGKMLHAVASLPSESEDAVESVLAHMQSTGLRQISPHMALILVRRHLDGRHPSSRGIRSLLERHGFTSIHTGDQRLWEHVMSAYAVLGDARSAMELHGQLRGSGRAVTHQFALRDLLIALVEREDWESARAVVDKALADVSAAELPERRWRHHFWHSAYKYGLIDWDAAPQDLMRVVDQQRFLSESRE